MVEVGDHLAGRHRHPGVGQCAAGLEFVAGRAHPDQARPAGETAVHPLGVSAPAKLYETGQHGERDVPSDCGLHETQGVGWQSAILRRGQGGLENPDQLLHRRRVHRRTGPLFDQPRGETERVGEHLLATPRNGQRQLVGSEPENPSPPHRVTRPPLQRHRESHSPVAQIVPTLGIDEKSCRPIRFGHAVERVPGAQGVHPGADPLFGMTVEVSGVADLDDRGPFTETGRTTGQQALGLDMHGGQRSHRAQTGTGLTGFAFRQHAVPGWVPPRLHARSHHHDHSFPTAAKRFSQAASRTAHPPPVVPSGCGRSAAGRPPRRRRPRPGLRTGPGCRCPRSR